MQKTSNLFLFPIIVLLVLIFMNTPKKYNDFKALSSDKMFKWQWGVLDRVIRM